jgi:prolyl-tRNA synthetase
MFLAPWKCSLQNEEAVKEECKATIRCYPTKENEGKEEAIGKMKCFYSGEKATHMALFARAY